MREELATHLERWGAHLYRDVNPRRPGYDGHHEALVRERHARTRDVGAVHLELGTWTAFPDERVAQLRREEALAEFVRLDFEPDYRPDVAADVTRLPFRDESLDRVGSNSLFEHVAYPHRIIEETFRVLRPGGVMTGVMPFVFNLHGYPDDYVRLTPSFFERVCAETGFVDVATDVEAAGGLYYTLHNSAKAAIAEGDAARALHTVTMTLLGALIPLDREFEGQARHWFHSVRVCAVKPGEYVPSARPPADPGRPFAERALDLLADPLTGAPLSRRGDRLVSRSGGARYEVRDGVPIFTRPLVARRPKSARRFAAWRLELARRRLVALAERGA